MKKCIFCSVEEKTNNKFTIEHIIPEAFGNKTLKIDSVCSNCNLKLGDNIDCKIADSDLFRLARSAKKIKGKKGSVNYVKEGKDKEGNSYVVKNLNEYKRKPKIETNQNELKVTASSIEEGKKIIETKLLKKGYSEEKINELLKSASIVSNKIPEINIPIEHDLKFFYLEGLKITYEYLYACFGEEFINSRTGNEIKAILLNAINGNLPNYEDIKTYFIEDNNINDMINFLIDSEINVDRRNNCICAFSDNERIYVCVSLLGYSTTVAICNELKINNFEEIIFA